MNHGSVPPRRLPYDLLKEITEDFSEERKLGSGAYGQVYMGVNKDGEKIAVKLLYFMPSHDDNDKQFDKEFYNLARLEHPNIVRFVGYCHETHRECVLHNGKMVLADVPKRALCFEYMHNGSLDKCLSDESTGHDWHTRYAIIKGICKGLKYLHEELESPIYHLDLKPANVLLDENMVPKIADFGLSRFVGEERTRITTSFMGTIGYLPPEFIHRREISNKLDIFSLGVVIIKIMTGPTCYSQSANMSSQKFIDHVHANWRNKLLATSMDMLESYCEQVKRCIEIALSCVEDDRNKRPTIGHIVRELNKTETMSQFPDASQNDPGSSANGTETISQFPDALQNDLGPSVDQESQQTHITELEERMRRRLNMAKNLFGEVVDNYKLDQMERYLGKPKTREDRAREALNLVNEDGKDVKACKYLYRSLGPVWIKGLQVPVSSTWCFVYNATGDTLYHVTSHVWWHSPKFYKPYPAEIGNGQWAAFHHCPFYFKSMIAAMVYRGKNKDGKDQDYLFAWSNPLNMFGTFGRNKAYCEIGDVDYFQTRGDDILDKLLNSDYSSDAKSDGCEIDAKIGKGSSPHFIVRITSLMGHLQHWDRASMDP